MSATVLYMSMSLDGFIAGPNARMGNGLGDGGERLHEWSFNGQFSRSPPICSTRGRINIFERWESQAARETFRSSGPDAEQRPAMLTVSVQEYDIADVRPVLGKEAE